MRRAINIIAFILFSLSLLTITAQQNTSVEERLAKLQEKLNLTEEQSDAIEEILIESKESAQKIREENESSRVSMAMELRDLFKETGSKIEAQLDGEQKETYKKMVEEARQNFKSRRNSRN